ncbi:MAG: adenylyl-sulfate kinase [Planctomycetes bacterium]|nr:adenylyl-sulfate kinase [Planctomycetota bacterium]
MDPAHRTGAPTQQGTVYWLTGLAGVGKSTLARLLAARLRAAGRAVVLLDGDELRARLFPEAGYAREERLMLARRYAGLCGLVAAQGPDVVCATISLFPEIWNENRRLLPAYREVLVRAPAEERRRRRPELHAGTADSRGPVVGAELAAPEPHEPHAILDNDGRRSPEQLIDELLAAFAARGPACGMGRP